LIMVPGGQVFRRFELLVVPQMAPIDGIFRYFEPSESHYTIGLPPFCNLIDKPGISVVVSDPEVIADTLSDTSVIALKGRVGDTMTCQGLTVFVYGEQFKTDLIATVRVEVHSRQVIYTKAKIGYQSQHTLSLPTETGKQIRVFPNKPNIVY